MDQIFGIVERISFKNDESGFAVLKIMQPRKRELTTVVGKLSHINPGESVRLQGNWKSHPTHGKQLEVEEVEIESPSDLYAIQKYLESGLIHGIGSKYATRIVETFKDKTLEVIDKEPNKLLKVSGIGIKRLNTIKSSWAGQKTIREVMIFLQKYHVSPAYAQKIYKIYGAETIERMKENPFHLATHIPGIGFKTADAIAEKMGLPKNADTRIDAAIEYHLSELAGEGHTCFPLQSFIETTEAMIGCELQERLEALTTAQKIVQKESQEEKYIWSKKLYIAEKGIAKELKRLSENSSKLRSIDSTKAIKWAEEILDIQLAEEQKKAVAASLTDKIHVITGGPGTGKSTITKTILAITSALTQSIILAAPTGRAAKRMSEITKKSASTIHSLLQYDFATGGFKRGHSLPLECDLIIIDEASMIDTYLMYHLLKAIPDHARLLLVGDINQLPSVGPGNVLKDLIESQLFSTTLLKEIFRQAKGSKIITNAHMINEGVFPDLTTEPGGDFFFISAETGEQILSKIIELITTRLPKKYNLDPINDIQILAPMRRGVIGIENLNQTLQKVLNPNTEGISMGGINYLLGDKVMQIRNNYTKEVYNGDIGTIISINEEKGEVTLRFDHKKIEYTRRELDEIVLAYATSIHKYQGSECPCVIIPMHTSHFMMLQKNLLYTGVTRGKRLVILVGAAKAIAMAVSNDKANKRYTGLQEALSVHTSGEVS